MSGPMFGPAPRWWSGKAAWPWRPARIIVLACRIPPAASVQRPTLRGQRPMDRNLSRPAIEGLIASAHRPVANELRDDPLLAACGRPARMHHTHVGKKWIVTQ